MRRALAAAARFLFHRASALEAALGVGLVAVGTAMFSIGAAFIVTGGLLLTSAAWPHLRRGR